jgi:hypothetical protein
VGAQAAARALQLLRTRSKATSSIMPYPTDSGAIVDHSAASATQGQGAEVHEQAPRVDAGAVGDRHAAARNGRTLRHRKSTTSIGSAQPLAAGLAATATKELCIGEDGVDSSSSGRSGGGADDGSHAGAGLPQHAAGHVDRPSVAAVPARVPGDPEVALHSEQATSSGGPLSPLPSERYHFRDVTTPNGDGRSHTYTEEPGTFYPKTFAYQLFIHLCYPFSVALVLSYHLQRISSTPAVVRQ